MDLPKDRNGKLVVVGTRVRLLTLSGRHRKPTDSIPLLDRQGLSSGAARPVCDSEFAGQPGQMLVGCPERRVGDKGGSE